MRNAILAKEATLSTLEITVRSLSINGKQMTLAVFRQFPIIEATDRDGNLNDLEWWGWVNYRIADQGDVWAIGRLKESLYRAPMMRYKELLREADWAESYLEEALRRERACSQALADLISENAIFKKDRMERELREAREHSARARAHQSATARNRALAKSHETLHRLPQLFIAT